MKKSLSEFLEYGEGAKFTISDEVRDAMSSALKSDAANVIEYLEETRSETENEARLNRVISVAALVVSCLTLIATTVFGLIALFG